MYFITCLFYFLGSYPSPIPQYNPQLNGDKHIISSSAAQNVSKQYVYEGNATLNCTNLLYKHI